MRRKGLTLQSELILDRTNAAIHLLLGLITHLKVRKRLYSPA